ncbi:MAG: small multi-drug export protein [Nanoarchaeota archaeon]|nr:small multi-drug export protein [Nanoarchaeota archaeon]
MSLTPWIILIFLSLLPLVELRLAIPAGILSGSVPFFFGWTVSGLGLPAFLVLPLIILTNTLLGFGIFDVLHKIDDRLRRSSLHPSYTKFLDHTQKKLAPFVKKYGFLGVALFISLPIPGSGVYIGSIGSFVLGVPKSSFRKACFLGVVLASVLVTILTVTGQSLFG